MATKHQEPSTEQHRLGLSEHNKQVRSPKHRAWASLDRHPTSEYQRLVPLDHLFFSLPEQLHLG